MRIVLVLSLLLLSTVAFAQRTANATLGISLTVLPPNQKPAVKKPVEVAPAPAPASTAPAVTVISVTGMKLMSITTTSK